MFRVRFLPDGAEALIPAGTTLTAAAAAAHVAMDAPCGHRGLCGKCRVRVVSEGLSLPLGEGDRSPLSPPTLPERTLLSNEELATGWRLACQARVAGEVTVEVPERTVKPAVVPLSEVEPRPFIRKFHVPMETPTLEDVSSDLTRLRRALADERPHLRLGLSALRKLPAVLSSASYDVTAVLAGDRLIGLEGGDTTGVGYGLAVDLGTTSVVVVLAELATGQVLGIETRLNGQANFGSDVVSRITYATMESEGLQTLQQAAVSTINSAIEALADKHNIDPRQIYEVAIVGNSCMNHLLLGIDPTSLAQAPYQPVLTDAMACRAEELGLGIHPEGSVYTLPNIAGFVGSDTVAVILATGMHRSSEIKLAIDLGTNGEIVLGNRDRLLSCSTAAGPAFEGARISSGMRAAEGAIERVWIDEGDVKLQVIGNRAPIGLCGSGLLDAVAQMRRVGLLDQSGRISTPDSLDRDLIQRLTKRLVVQDGTQGFLLGRHGQQQVVLTQRDVRELQLAKGAVRAGISILLKEYGIGEDDIEEILLAGAFGSFINPASARAIGLVPPLPLQRITAVGNAAGQGAIMALLSTSQRDESSAIARRVEYVELSSRPDFMQQFMEDMQLTGGNP